MMTPVVVTWLSRSRSGLSAPSSRNRRLPPPTTTGSIITRNSSTRSWATSVCTNSLLPITCRSWPSSCFSAATASPTSSWSTVEFCHARGSASVLDATYLGLVLSGSARTCSSSDAFGQWAAKISSVPRPRRKPPAVLEAAGGVLGGLAGRLDGSVEGHPLVGDRLAHLGASRSLDRSDGVDGRRRGARLESRPSVRHAVPSRAGSSEHDWAGGPPLAWGGGGDRNCMA